MCVSPRIDLEMPPNTQVNIKWQILFSLISPLNIWAFYRIKKLQKFLLYVLVPSMIVGGSLFGIGYYEITIIEPLEDYNNKYPPPTRPPHMTPIEPQVRKFDAIPYLPIGVTAYVGFSALSVYLAIKWSREWNQNEN